MFTAGSPSPVARIDLSPFNLIPTHTLTSKRERERENVVTPPPLHRSKWHYIGGPFAHDLEVTHKLFVLSPNNKYLVTAGHWDNSLRVHSIERTKITARVLHHNGECGLTLQAGSCHQWLYVCE